MAVESEAAGARPGSVDGEAGDTLLGESRWPPAAAVLAFMAINIAVRIWLPGEGVIRVPWLLPSIEGVLLVVLVTSDPAGSAERWRLRRLAAHPGRPAGRGGAVGHGAPGRRPDQGHARDQL